MQSAPAKLADQGLQSLRNPLPGTLEAVSLGAGGYVISTELLGELYARGAHLGPTRSPPAVHLLIKRTAALEAGRGRLSMNGWMGLSAARLL